MPNIVFSDETLLNYKLIEHEIFPVVEEMILDEDEKAYKVVGVINKTTVTRFLGTRK